MNAQVAQQMSMHDAKRRLREIFRDSPGPSNMISTPFRFRFVLTLEEITEVVILLQQHPALAASRKLCRRDIRYYEGGELIYRSCNMLLPLSALLRHGCDRVTVHDVGLVYKLYPEACALGAYGHEYEDESSGQGGIHDHFPLHFACRYASLEVIEFIMRASPRALHDFNKYSPPINELLYRGDAYLTSRDFLRAMNMLLDGEPRMLLHVVRWENDEAVQANEEDMDPRCFGTSFFHRVIDKGLVDCVKDIVRHHRFLPRGLDFFSIMSELHVDSVKALAVILPKLKTFRFVDDGDEEDKGHNEDAVTLLQEELLKCHSLECFQVSWQQPLERMDDLCLELLRKLKKIRELTLKGLWTNAFKSLKLVDYANILENHNTLTCVTISFDDEDGELEEAEEYAKKHKDILDKIHFFSFWNKHGRRASNNAKMPLSELVPCLVALKNDNTPQLTDEIKLSVSYELLRASPGIWLDNVDEATYMDTSE